MGVAGSVLKPHPCNFEILFILLDVEIILLSFFDDPNQKYKDKEKLILSSWFILPAVQIRLLIR